MQLAKAIEILTLYRNQFSPKTDFDYAQSVSLSIEALKAIAAWRNDWIGNRFYFLPGESYDDPSPRPKPLFNNRFPPIRMRP